MKYVQADDRCGSWRRKYVGVNSDVPRCDTCRHISWVDFYYECRTCGLSFESRDHPDHARCLNETCAIDRHDIHCVKASDDDIKHLLSGGSPTGYDVVITFKRMPGDGNIVDVMRTFRPTPSGYNSTTFYWDLITKAQETAIRHVADSAYKDIIESYTVKECDRRRYEVTIDLGRGYSDTVTVEARSGEEAEEKALDEMLEDLRDNAEVEVKVIS